MQQQEDWFGYLKLSPDATTEQIEQAVERLSRQAAAMAVTAPERSQQLRERVRAIKRDLLSGPESRQRYDVARAAATRQAMPPAPQAWPPAPQVAPPAQPFPPPPPPVAPGVPMSMPAAPVPGSPAAAPASEGVGSRFARFLRTGWTCSSCGKDALPSDKFCTKCGSPIKALQPDLAPRARLACANCAAPLAAADSFCAKCGTPVRK
jgi:Double zinc ribbon